MSFRDRILTCVVCGEQFVFSAGEQLFFHDKQFKNEPKRCKPCKLKSHSDAKDTYSGKTDKRVETNVTCQSCGAPTTVPFLPTQGRPVLCRDCYSQQRRQEQPAQDKGNKEQRNCGPVC